MSHMLDLYILEASKVLGCARRYVALNRTGYIRSRKRVHAV